MSKFELWVQSRIKEEFPNLEVLYSCKEALGDVGEVDIWIPSLKMGIEIQGPSHYLPIFGQEKLENEQKNDQAKRDEAKKLGIDLIEVNISDLKSFKDFKFVLRVSEVLDVIRKKLKS